MKIFTVATVTIYLFNSLNGAPLQQNYLSHQIFEDREEKGAALNNVVSFCYQFVNYFMLFMYYQPLLERLHNEFVKIFGKTTTLAPKTVPQYEYYDSIEPTTRLHRRHRHKRRRKRTSTIDSTNDADTYSKYNSTANTFFDERTPIKSNQTTNVNKSDNNRTSSIANKSNFTEEPIFVMPLELKSSTFVRYSTRSIRTNTKTVLP